MFGQNGSELVRDKSKMSSVTTFCPCAAKNKIHPEKYPNLRKFLSSLNKRFAFPFIRGSLDYDEQAVQAPPPWMVGGSHLIYSFAVRPRAGATW